LDLAAFAYYDCLDSSRQSWVEVRYHWTKLDLALQWQVNSGSPGKRIWGAPGPANLAGAGEVLLLTARFRRNGLWASTLLGRELTNFVRAVRPSATIVKTNALSKI
jgi:hypothetical protein